MFSRLVKQFSEKEGVTETLKAENQMHWVQKINNLRNAAMEIVSMNLFIANTAQVRSPSTDGGFSHFGCNLKVIFGENSNNKDNGFGFVRPNTLLRERNDILQYLQFKIKAGYTSCESVSQPPYIPASVFSLNISTGIQFLGKNTRSYGHPLFMLDSPCRWHSVSRTAAAPPWSPP